MDHKPSLLVGWLRLLLCVLIALQADAGWLLTTAAPVAQAAGQAPILLVINSADSANPFGNYLGEILRAEGLNDFDVKELSVVTPTLLAGYPVVILAATSVLTSTPAAALTSYVAAGGHLIAMQPDSLIKDLFGLGAHAGSLPSGYLKFDTSQAVAQGLTSGFMQIHVPADEYSLAPGAVTVGQLYTDTADATPYPAVVLSATVAAFTYDLARNIAYTRQGDPANANKIFGSPSVLDDQGIAGTWDPADPPVTRTTSLFQLSNVITAPAWIDRNLIPIPQADEQQRLLARLVQAFVSASQPMPQLWYFPGTAKTMLILTGDAHANPTSYYQNEINSLSAYGASQTFYVSIAAEPTDNQLQAWRDQGFEFGIHPYASHTDGYTVTSLLQGYQAAAIWWPYSTPWSPTVRNHQLAWVGWTDAADLAASYGIAMDTSFYDWGAWLQKTDGTWPHGYITGSGQPMKFVRTDGTLVPEYQQLTELVDEQFITGADFGFEGLTPGQAVAVSNQLIDASLAGDYAALTAQFHVDYYNTIQPWAEATMAYANSKGVPIWNADQWLSFTETRHDANFTDVAWNAGSRTLSFTQVAAATAGITLTTMLPATYGGYGLQSVTMHGASYPFTLQTIKGQPTAFVSAPAGSHDFTAVYGGPLPSGSSQANLTSACATLNGAQTNDNGGVSLAAAFADDFTGSTLDASRWISGTWSGSDAPTFGNSQITVPPHIWVRSASPVNYGVLDGTVQFGAGTYQHFGFAADTPTFGNHFLLWSTSSTTNSLFARVEANGVGNTSSALTLPGGLHRYRIDWSKADAVNDAVNFYLDSTFIYSATVAHSDLGTLYAYLSNDGSANLTADYVQAQPPYVPTGQYTSCVLDAKPDYAWQTINWDALTNGGTLTVEARTSFDANTWGSWQPVSVSPSALAQPARYAQFRLSLAATSPYTSTPLVNSVTLAYAPSAVQVAQVSSPPAAAIGQTVNYTLSVTVPQTTTYGLLVTEALPAGLSYNPGSWSLQGITFSPVFTTTGPTDGSGPETLAWNFGNAVFSASPGALLFSGTVANVSGNQRGTVLTTTGTVNYTNSGGAPQTPLTVSNATTVLEPALTLHKAIVSLPSPADAGGQVQYEVSIADPGGANTSPAYDVVYTDTLPAGLSLNTPLTITGASGVNQSAGNTVTVTFASLDSGANPVIDYGATLSSVVTPSAIVTNTGDLAWTSLPGAGPSERTGAGGVNSYFLSSSAAFTTSDPSLSLVLAGTSDSDTAGSNVTIGEVLTYSLGITLPEGTTPALQLLDSLPPGLAFVTGTVSVDVTGFGGSLPAPVVSSLGGSGDAVTINFGSISVLGDNDPSNNTFKVRLQARVLDVPGNIGGVTTLPDSASLQIGSGPVFTVGPVTASVVEPAITLSQSVVPPSAAASDTVTFSLVLTNTGTAEAYDVGLQEPLLTGKFSQITSAGTPAGFTFGTSVSGTNVLVSYTGGTVPAGAAATFTFNATLTGGVVPFEVLSNTATVTQTTTLPGADPFARHEPAVSASASLNVTVPDLAAGVTDHLASLVPGQIFTYSLVITNTGQHLATGVVFSDTLSPNVIYQSATGGVTRAGNVLTWNIPSLSGLVATAPYTVTVQVTSPVAALTTVITNTVSVRDDGLHGADLTPSDNTMTESDALVAAPDLAVTKGDGGVTAVPGAQVIYTIAYTNTGNIAATNVLITDVVPTYSTFVAGASYPGWHASSAVAGTPITINVGQVAGGGAHGILTYTVRVADPLPAGGGPLSLANTVLIGDDGANGADSNPNNNTANTTTAINAAPDLQIGVADGVSGVAPGGWLTYTLTITNAGNRNASGVVITDSLPAGVTFKGASFGQSPSGGVVTWNLSGLAGLGVTATYTVAVEVPLPAPAGISPLVNAGGVRDDGQSGSDSNPGNNVATISNLVTGGPDLQIGVTDDVSGVAPGGWLTYTLTITNAGNRNANGVVITDSLPAGVAFKGASFGQTPSGGVVTWNLSGLTGLGVTATYTVAVQVPLPAPAGISPLVNAVGVRDDGLNGADSNPGNNVATISNLVTGGPDLQIGVTDGVSGVAPGGWLTYTLTITNAGNRNASGVVITDSLPAGVTFKGASFGQTPSGGVVTWILSGLSGLGVTATYTVAVQVPLPASAGISPLVNTAGVRDDGLNGADSNPSNNVATISNLVTGGPDLQIGVTDGVSGVAPGGWLTYTLTITNAGNRNANGVVITDSLPAGVAFKGASFGQTPSNGVVTWTLSGLAGLGVTATYTVAVEVPLPAPAGISPLVNAVGVRDDGQSGSDSNPGNNVATISNLVTGGPDLQIGVTDGVSGVAPGGWLTYTLTITNAGNRNASGVVITDSLPAGVTFKGASFGQTPSGGVVTWILSGLSGLGVTATYTVAVEVPLPASPGISPLVNTAGVTDDGLNGADSNPGNNVATISNPVTGGPDLQIGVTDGVSGVAPGGWLTYTLTVRNIGNWNSTGVVVTDALPAGVIFQEATLGQFPSGNVLTWTLSGLAALGPSAIYTATVQVPFPAPAGLSPLVNSVAVGDDGQSGPDLNLSDNVATITNPVSGGPDLQIGITDGAPGVAPGDWLTYTLTITNAGSRNASGVVVTDSLPAGVTFKGASGGPVLSGGVMTWTVGGMTSLGTTATFTVAVQVPFPAPAGISPLVNAAGVRDDGLNGADSNPSNNVASITNLVTGGPDLQIGVTDGASDVAPGDWLTYTLTITNAGNRNASGVVITDSLPAGVTFKGASSGQTLSNGVVTWNLSGLAGLGVTATYTVSVQVVYPVPARLTQLTDSAGITDDNHNGTDSDLTNNVASDTDLVNAAANLGITVSSSLSAVTPGGVGPYTLSYNNSGNRDAAGVTLTETVPMSTTFDAGDSTAGWACADLSSAGTTCTDAVGTVPGAGGSGTALFAVHVIPVLPAGTTAITDTASIGDNGVSGPDRSYTYPLPVVKAPDLAVALHVTPSFFAAGQTLTYTIVYSNGGVGPATGVVITATIPPGTDFLNTAGWNCSSATCTYTVPGTVAGGGAGGTVNFAVKVLSPAPPDHPGISQTVQIGDDGTHGVDWRPANNVATLVTSGAPWRMYLPFLTR